MPLQLEEEVAVPIPVRRPGAAIAAAVAEAVGPAPVAGDKRRSHRTLEEYHEDLARWKAARTDTFAGEDLASINHRDGLDRRVAGLRTRAEAIGAELVEMVDEYGELQRRDDVREADREAAYGALCQTAEAHGQELPTPPGSVGQYYDATRGLRDVEGKLVDKIVDQRRDRAPDWLPSIAAVFGATGQAWMEMSEPPDSLTDPDEQYVCVAKRRLDACGEGDSVARGALEAELAAQTKTHALRRAAVEAIKALGEHVREQWAPEYNLANHADGTVETIEANVIEEGVPFDYNDRYGTQWLRHLQRTERASEDLKAPLTGPRTNGRLDFTEGAPSSLPFDYSHLNREAAIRAAIPLLSEDDVAAHIEANAKEYTKAVRVQWYRDRPNERFTTKTSYALVRDLACCQIIKGRLDAPALAAAPAPADPIGEGLAKSEEVVATDLDLPLAASEVCEPPIGDAAPDAAELPADAPVDGFEGTTEAVTARIGAVELDADIDTIYDTISTVSPLETPWFQRP